MTNSELYVRLVRLENETYEENQNRLLRNQEISTAALAERQMEEASAREQRKKADRVTRIRSLMAEETKRLEWMAEVEERLAKHNESREQSLRWRDERDFLTDTLAEIERGTKKDSQGHLGEMAKRDGVSFEIHHRGLANVRRELSELVLDLDVEQREKFAALVARIEADEARKDRIANGQFYGHV